MRVAVAVVVVAAVIVAVILSSARVGVVVVRAAMRMSVDDLAVAVAVSSKMSISKLHQPSISHD